MVTKKPKRRSPFEGFWTGALFLGYALGLFTSCSEMAGGNPKGTIWFLALIALGGLGVGLFAVFERVDVRSKFDRLVYAPCAVCGRPSRDGHGCHVEAIARAVGRRKNFNGTYGRTWNGVVRDHYGALPVFRNHKHHCADGPCQHSEAVQEECGHEHRYQHDAQLCAWERMRAVQKGEAADGLVVGPRPGAESVAHRVPLTDIDWPKMLREADYCCHYCGDQFEPAFLEKEHKTPLTRGGDNHPSNIVVSCAPCNREKGTMTETEYAEFREKVEQREKAPRNSGRKRSRRTYAGEEAKGRYPGLCPCGGKFKLRTGPYGRFYGCSRFPSCKETRPLAKNRKNRS